LGTVYGPTMWSQPLRLTTHRPYLKSESNVYTTGFIHTLAAR